MTTVKYNNFWSYELVDKNRNRFFRIYREIVEDGTWAALPLSSKKIYPIIGIHAGRGKAFPRRSRIMILSGYTKLDTFKEGVEGLKKLKLISAKDQSGKQTIYKLLDKKYRDEENNEEKFFQIKSEYIFSGNWALLPATAVAVYVVLGVFSNPIHFDSNIPEWLVEYAENIDDSILNEDFFSNFRVSKLSLTEIVKYSGVSRASVIKSINIMDDMYRMLKRPTLDKDDFNINPSNLYIIPLLHYFDGRGNLLKGFFSIDPNHLNQNKIHKIRHKNTKRYSY